MDTMNGKDASTLTSASSTSEKLQTAEDLTVFVADLLDQMQQRFSSMGDSIMGRMDELSGRLDELERSIAELMDQAGLEPQYGTTGNLISNANNNNNNNSNSNNNNNGNSEHSKKESKTDTQRSII